jgi:hypothetical protein
MVRLTGKVSRALSKKKVKLQLPTMTNQLPERGHYKENVAFGLKEDELEDKMTSVSHADSTSSRMSKDTALLHKVKNQQRKIKAKAAISNEARKEVSTPEKHLVNSPDAQNEVKYRQPEAQTMAEHREEDTEQKTREAENWQHRQTSFHDLKPQELDSKGGHVIPESGTDTENKGHKQGKSIPSIIMFKFILAPPAGRQPRPV